MSDLSAAAAALGLPEPIVQRSAAARAAATGMSVDEVLAAWAGGGAAPAAPAREEPAEAADEVAAEPAEDAAPAAAEAEPAEEAAPAAAPVSVALPPAAPVPAAPATPARPPLLVGEADRPMTVVLGALGLFLAVFLLGLIGPSIPVDQPGALTSRIPFGAEAEQGRVLYRTLGCASCHTQMVRPIVADVGLGAVTLNDSNQVLGTRRFGPDLSNVGARLTRAQLEATVGGLGGHPAASLAAEDMAALVAYLAGSATLEVAPSGEATE